MIKLVLVKLEQCRVALTLRFFFILQRNLIKEKAQAMDLKNLSDDIHFAEMNGEYLAWFR